MTFLALLILSLAVAYAGNTGKIAGKIIDKNSGEPLIGANVWVVDTHLGSSTDVLGRYFILQIPPGKYELKISYIGYQQVIVKNVTVQFDLTTQIDIQMESDVLETEEVVIVAEKPLVQHDITSTRTTTSREAMENMPGMENSLDIFKVRSGAITDVIKPPVMLANGQQLQVRDESLKDVHIRGGRGGEILYMVDGVPVTHPIYGGRSVLDLNVNDIDEIELLTGGFNAEYGQAQSGVVNITTRSGKDKLEGGIEYKTDYWHPIGSFYDTQYITFSFGGPGILSRHVLPKLGVQLPGELNFFLSGSGNLTNTEYDNHRTRSDLSILDLKLKEKQDNSANINGKIDWFLSDNIRFAFNYHGSWKRWSRFDWLWNNYPDNTVSYQRTNSHLALKFVHTLSKSTFYQLNIGYLGVKYRASLEGVRPDQFWTFYCDSTDQTGMTYHAWQRDCAAAAPYRISSRILSPETDALTGFFNDKGCENIWRDDDTKTFSFRGDFTSQINNEHLIKFGAEIQWNDLQYIDIQDGGVQLSRYGMWKYNVSSQADSIAAPPGPFPEFGQTRWVFFAKPMIGGFYIQDKYERKSLIINAGFRCDWFVPGESIFNEQYQEQWELATGLDADWKKFRFKLSPRFGISFPISVRTALFFSYGHFTQLPELQFMYRDPYSGGFTGNPGLDYEQTVLYEFGFTNQLSKNWVFDIKSYAKDISQQVGTTNLRSAAGLPVSLYDNNGYARARGLEFRFNRRHDKFISGDITYTVQWATGYSSSAFDDYIRSINDFPNPIRERRLGWDVRHQIILQTTMAVPDNSQIKFFNLKLPEKWSLTILSNFASGYPFTPGSTSLIELQTKENTKTGPFTSNTDLKFQKWFTQLAGIRVTLFLDIFNLFNQNNVQIGYGFNSWTGKPYRYGDPIENQKQLYNWYEMYRLMDPRQFSTNRYAKIGLKLNW